MKLFDIKRCLIDPKPRQSIYWHQNPDSKEIWCFCNACDRAYSIYSYCNAAGISLKELLTAFKETDFSKTSPDEVRKMEWPEWFLSLSDPRSKPAVDYIRSRGLTLEGDMYYDSQYGGVAFPLYYDQHFCGAQTRLIRPWINESGEETRVLTLPGTRTGLLFYGWNQAKFVTDTKGLIITEGPIDALSIQQSLNLSYGSVLDNPWKVVATCGAGVSEYRMEAIKKLKEAGIKIVLCPDNDNAGLKMLSKFIEAEAITHCAFTDSDLDWNDELKKEGREKFSQWFLQRVKHV